MELINREHKSYGPPQHNLKAHEPESDIRCVWQCSVKERTHYFTVRGQRVGVSSTMKAAAGNSYRLCYFGHVEQWVREENIASHKLNRK